MQKKFKEIAAEWSAAKRPMVKHSTMCAYLLILQSHLLPHFGDKFIITENEVQQFVLQKIQRGLSRKTIKDIVAVLKAVAKYGRKHKLFPYEDWEIEYPTQELTKKLPTLTLKQQRLLMRYLVEQPTPQNIGVLLALCTGMRIGEVCALEWKDVDLTQRIITVKNTVGRVYNCELKCTQRVCSSPKTKNSYREIPISKQLLQCLKMVKRIVHTPYVVGTLNQSKEPRAYRSYFKRLQCRLGIPPIVFHGLRHTFATRCIESKCDYKTVSAILGHSNVATTLNLYVHPNFEQKKKCVEQMSKFLGLYNA